MARKPLQIAPAQPIDNPADDAAFERLEQSANQLITLRQEHDDAAREVARSLGYQLPAECADPDLIQRDIAANMRVSVESCLEVGRGLLVLKAACGRGNFLARLEVLGIETRLAQRFMSAAAKFSNAAISPHLVAAIGNQSKLFELLVLDDEQIIELAETGETDGLTRDDIANKSTSELRKLCRDLRGKLQAKDAVLKKESDDHDALKTEYHEFGGKRADQQLLDIQQRLAAKSLETLALINGAMRLGMNELRQHCDATGLPVPIDVMAGYLGPIRRVMLELQEEHALPDVVGDGKPQWEREAEAMEALDAARAAAASKAAR